MSDPAPSAAVIDIDQVRFIAGPAAEGQCSVCGCAAPHESVLQVPSMADAALTLTLLRCPACGSAFYDPPGIRDFSDHDQAREELWRFYVEMGGGVWETIWPVLAGATRGSLLDVGCGFGFLLDFWTRTDRGEACGVELADYGAIGARKLGVTIYAERLEQCAALAGRAFDVVYASEVIEHVPDPHAFVVLLARWVADDGVLILTTPNAGFIAPENRSTTLLAALAPGFHGFLLSAKALEDTARRAGFAHVHVRSFGERLFLWASRREFEPRFDWASMQLPYLRFLRSRLEVADTDVPVWQGYAYRYLRDLVSTGRNAEAQRVADLLGASVARSHGAEALDPGQSLPRFAAARTLVDNGRIGPFFLPCLYYMQGELARRGRADAQRSRALYEGAIAAIEACARIGAIFYGEAISLYWPSRVALAELDLEQGRLAEAIATIVSLVATGRVCSAANAYALAPATLTEAVVPAFADTCLDRRVWPQALEVYDAYCGYVARHYGEAMLGADGIEAALGGPADAMPLDPLFPLWFEGKRVAIESGGRAPDCPALHAVIRLGEKFAAHPRCGARLRDLARRARKRAGLAPQPYVFDMSYTLPPAGPAHGA